MAKNDTLKNAAEDRRAVDAAMMAVNEALTQAAMAARALVADTKPLKDKELSASAGRLLEIITTMKSGPNIAVWTELRTLETSINAKFREE
ncbi:MAG: hypothetical protein R3C24_04980 [Cyanobacteriota/Melainabacteria group bacterium]|nr:hypothetical protein [Cyanobacteria bacterium HKST-UBA01]